MDSAVVFSRTSSSHLKQTWFLCVLSPHGLWGKESTFLTDVHQSVGSPCLYLLRQKAWGTFLSQLVDFFFLCLVPSFFKDYGESGSTVCSARKSSVCWICYFRWISVASLPLVFQSTLLKTASPPSPAEGHSLDPVLWYFSHCLNAALRVLMLKTWTPVNAVLLLLFLSLNQTSATKMLGVSDANLCWERLTEESW